MNYKYKVCGKDMIHEIGMIRPQVRGTICRAFLVRAG